MKKTMLFLGLACISQGHANNQYKYKDDLKKYDSDQSLLRNHDAYPSVNGYTGNSKVMNDFTKNREYAADFDSEPQHIVVHQGKDDLTLEQLAKKVCEKDDLSKIKGVTSEDEIKLVRDLIYTWGGQPNQFLNTPVVLLNKQQKDKIVRVIKYLKHHSKDTAIFAKKVTRYMKNLSNVERAYALMVSGLNPEDLTTNFTEYSSFVDKMIGRKLYRKKVYQFIDEWEKSQDRSR